MKIAIDLTPLQSPHRLRGVGSVIINFMNHLSDKDKKRSKFIFYVSPTTDSYGDPLELLDLSDVTYTVVESKNQVPEKSGRSFLPHKLSAAISILNKSAKKLRVFYFGDNRLSAIGEVDVFLQFEQLKPLPKGKAKKALVLYDIIPYVLEADYLWTYKTARKHGSSVKGSIKRSLQRWFYVYRLKLNSRRADILLAISEKTKTDFVEQVGVQEAKITVTPLGVDPVIKNTEVPQHHYYNATSWGYLKNTYEFEENIPFILFVGGVDPRRKLDRVVTAFNHIRASGQPLKLVLVGDILQGPQNIPVIETRNALVSSSYKDDIVYMGFVTDQEKNDLYKNALAFVYPSMYEGFGLPVLEAMSHGTPTITCDNSSIREVAGSAALYAYTPAEIENQINNLLAKPDIKSVREKSIRQALKYTWSNTADMIMKTLD